MRKKEDKKIAFLLTFLLVVGIFLIYANLKFTGLVTNIDSITNEAECIAANYTWAESTEEVCNSIEGCTLCITEDCETNCQTCENVTTGECGDSSYITQAECVAANYTWAESTEEVCNSIEGCTLCITEDCETNCQTCENVTTGQCMGNICGDGETQSPNDDGINEVCDDGENNGEYDYCAIDCLSEGTYCGDGIINGDEECDGSDLGTHTCEDEGFDGGTLTCDSDCTLNDDACSNDENDEDSDNEEIPTTTIITSNTVAAESSCTPNWECDDVWGECIDGTQVRTCVDINQCGSNEGMPEISQSCVVEIKETCSDGIKNQGEAGIDCGGPCENKCSIFTIVGSAISGPVGAGKDFVLKGMFGSKTKIIISVSVFVLITGMVVAFVLFKKGILKLPLKNSSKKEVKTQEM